MSVYFEDFLSYWQRHFDHLIPAAQVYLGRTVQDPPWPEYAVFFPLDSPEPEEDTGDTIIETLPFALHLHSPTDAVIAKGKTLWKKAPEGLAWAKINDNTLCVIRKSRRYVREFTDLHHYILAFDWIIQGN